MSVDTLGYVKRLEAGGFKREQAEAQAEALRDEVIPQLSTKIDLDRHGQRLESRIDHLEAKIESALWKHSFAVILAVVAVGGFLLRFNN
ncbi:MAG: hypothetical protein Q7T86_12155 [Hyphomicrobiaceae bacterium]|nr:hypothetical protein [Hyphomicrobiaceae bacterium]